MTHRLRSWARARWRAGDWIVWGIVALAVTIITVGVAITWP